MTTIIIEENNPQAKLLLEYIKTLPFAAVVEESKMSYDEAAKACDAVSVEEFFEELNNRISKRFEDA